MELEDVDCIDLAQNGNKWQAVMFLVTKYEITDNLDFSHHEFPNITHYVLGQDQFPSSDFLLPQNMSLPDNYTVFKPEFNVCITVHH